MERIGVFYATREGHTKFIAEHVGHHLLPRGLQPQVYDVRETSKDLDLKSYAGVVLAASVHLGRHEREMVNFVKNHRMELEAVPSAFLSVSLSEAGAERPNTTAKQHQQFVADVERVLETFEAETGWHPKYVKAVAGALPYSRYNLLVRFIMKHMAQQSGGDTDTSRDYTYTDWLSLDDFLDQFSAEIPGKSDAAQGAMTAP